MSESRDTAPDSPRTDRDAALESAVRLTPDVTFQPEEPTELNLELRGAEQLPPEIDEEHAELGSHTPVTAERQAIVGLDRTHRSSGAAGAGGASAGSTTSGHTQRSLSEIERPPTSLRVLDGRFQAIEQKLDQLDARLRLLEKRGDKSASVPRASWLFWVVVLVGLALFQLLLRRS